LTAAIGPEFDVSEAAKDVDTVGGLIMTQVGRLPLRGELVPGPAGFELEVIDADPRRIKKIKIHRSKDRPKQLRPGAQRGDVDTLNLNPAPVSPPSPPAPGDVNKNPTTQPMPKNQQ